MGNADVFGSAIDKIRDEMAGSKTRYVQVVGEMLTAFIQGRPDCAEKILQKGKTVAGSLEAMRNEARKKAEGGVGIIDDEEGLKIVLDYFGIESAENKKGGGGSETPASETEQERENGAEDELSLDALLGGL